MIPATAELLEGWCGPVVFEGQNCPFAHEVDPRNPDGDYTVLHDDRICDVSPEHLRLDLRRPEVQDRVSRVWWGASGVRLSEFFGVSGLWAGDRLAASISEIHGTSIPHVPALASLPDTDTLAWALWECWRVMQEVEHG